MGCTLWLLSYPPLEEIAHQLALPDWVDRFGLYTAQIPGKSITDRSIRRIDEVLQCISIAPRTLERVPSPVGRLRIAGVTREGLEATVDINPLADKDW